MKVSVNKPQFDDDFKARIAKAVAKELHSKITSDDDRVLVEVMSQNRVVGRYSFLKDDDVARLEKSATIEKDYYPFEFGIAEVVKYLKRKKIKAVEW